VPDCGDLGIGEDDTRRQRSLRASRHALAAIEDVLGRDPGLVLAHVGEQGAPVDVADRVQPAGGADAHPVVDSQVPAGLETDRLQAERGPGLRQLDADDAAPEHEQAPGYGARSRRIAVRPGRGLSEAGDGR
jgi:hypothetical protein